MYLVLAACEIYIFSGAKPAWENSSANHTNFASSLKNVRVIRFIRGIRVGKSFLPQTLNQSSYVTIFPDATKIVLCFPTLVVTTNPVRHVQRCSGHSRLRHH